MVQYIVKLKLGDPAVRRFTLLSGTEYEFVFKLFDTDGTALDTVESWKGRIAEAFIGNIRVFYTNNPEFAKKTLFIEQDTVVTVKFNSSSWTMQLIALKTDINLIGGGSLPSEISCERLSVSDTLTANKAKISEFLPPAGGFMKFSTGSGLVTIDKNGGILVGDSIRTGTMILEKQVRTPGNIYADNTYLSGDLSASSITVVEGSLTGSGSVNAQNVHTQGMFSNIMRIDELAKFNGTLELNAKTTIDTDGELQLNDGAVSMNGDTEIYCPTPKKDGGVTRYSPTIQWLEPPAVQEAGHYLLFKRVYD